MNIAALFHRNFDTPLLVNADQGGASWDGLGLFRQVWSISNSLRKLGVRPNSHVLLLTGNCGATFAFSLAVFNIGAVVVPVNPYVGQQALLEIVAGIRPSCCFFEVPLSQTVAEALDPICSIYVSLLTQPDGENPASVSFLSLLREGGPADFPDFPGDQPALLIHTSGSQGRQKAILYTHQALISFFCCHDLIHQQYGDSLDDNTPHAPLISVFHPSHLASYCLALQGLLMRRPTILMKSFVPREYLALISRYRCRISLLVPSMYELLLKEAGAFADADFPTWQICCSVGERTSEALASKIEETFGTTVFSCYGLTECLPGFAHHRSDLAIPFIKRGSCGKHLFGEIKLVDENGKETNPGELLIRNPTVHRCYVDDRFNQEKIQSDGWLRTGDLFYVDADGHHFHQGRIDDMFVVNGKNIYPAEIEFALLKHAHIERVVATFVLDRSGKVVPGALVQSQAALSESEVIGFYLKTGMPHAMPRFVRVVTQLPELGPGKVNRRECTRILQELFSSVN